MNFSSPKDWLGEHTEELLQLRSNPTPLNNNLHLITPSSSFSFPQFTRISQLQSTLCKKTYSYYSSVAHATAFLLLPQASHFPSQPHGSLLLLLHSYSQCFGSGHRQLFLDYPTASFFLPSQNSAHIPPLHIKVNHYLKCHFNFICSTCINNVHS